MLTIDQIRNMVADYFRNKPVKSVYLFRSYARGDAEESSDIDLLIEYDDSKKRLSLFDVLNREHYSDTGKGGTKWKN
jgi:predicted nucleotidyltransferase